MVCSKISRFCLDTLFWTSIRAFSISTRSANSSAALASAASDDEVRPIDAASLRPWRLMVLNLSNLIHCSLRSASACSRSLVSALALSNHSKYDPRPTTAAGMATSKPTTLAMPIPITVVAVAVAAPVAVTAAPAAALAACICSKPRTTMVMLFAAPRRAVRISPNTIPCIKSSAANDA